jgi:oxygen-dependent protoporphyrinogen oxidase
MRGASPHTDGAFRSLPGGLSEMVCALARILGPERLRVNSRVTAIDGSGPFVVRTSDGQHIDAKAIALTAPAFAVAALLRQRDADLARLCDDIRYVSVATVALAFPRAAVRHPLNGSGFVVPRSERALAARGLLPRAPRH